MSRIIPHLHAGDSTVEYEIKIHQTEETRRTVEYRLRADRVTTEATDGFDTTLNGWANDEHDSKRMFSSCTLIF